MQNIPSAVLDTNVVLDWMVFDNPVVRPLAEAIRAGRVQWLACQRMRDELAHVLGRGVGGPPDAGSQALSCWDAHAQLRPLHAPGAGERLHCTDADDQVFIDFAVVFRVRWLLTRDRALLKLAKRARRWDVDVVTPERWIQAFAAPA
ncbi:PIN domain-containing protein [Aquincola sp. MAHUQ-54]|uniref:PIN domain-containing protein n=1 Tax=Aquincola agrisoli TaxID=3119538 RepID=A0AAW9Q8F1_9BURK